MDDCHRCVACGKEIRPNQKAYRIADGRMNASGFNEKDLWGFAHRRCFTQAVDSPKTVMSELRRLAREPGTETAAS